MQTDVFTAACTMLLLWTHCISSLLAHNLLDDLEDEEVQREELSFRQATMHNRQLKGIYSHLLDYPALMQRRLYMGSKKPHIPPTAYHNAKSRNEEDTISSSAFSSNPQIRKRAMIRYSPNQKREFPLEIAESVCPARTEWRLLYWARDINNTLVEVFQPSQGPGEGQQWFYTVTCFNQAYRSRRSCDNCCIGIKHVSFSSACLQKKSFVMALIRRPWDKIFDWDWIQVDSSCNCAIAPRL